MTREERAELTILTAGVVLLAITLGGVVPLLQALAVPNSADSGRPLLLAALLPGLATAVVGYCFVLFSGKAAYLLRPRGEREGPEEELLRAAVFFLGAANALAACRTVLLTAGLPNAGQLRAAAALVGVWAVIFLARPRLLIGWLARRARARRQGDGLAGLVAAGIAFIGLIALVQSFTSVVGILVKPAAPAGSPKLDALVSSFSVGATARALVSGASGVVVAVLALAFCGRIGAWVARGAGEAPAAVAARMGRRGWIVCALVVTALFEAAGVLYLPNTVLSWASPVRPDVQEFMLCLGFPALAALLARPIARGLYPKEPDRADSRGGVLLALEAAITVILVFFAIVALNLVLIPMVIVLQGVDGPGSNAVQVQQESRALVGTLVLTAFLLAVRGDVARWCAWPPQEPADAKPTRAALLQPLLGLLGIYILMIHLPALPGRAATALGWIPSPKAPAADMPNFGRFWPDLFLPAAGLALVLAARPLARLLSYGPVLHRLVPAFWRLGWTRGTDRQGDRGQGEHE